MDKTIAYMKVDFTGLIFTNLVDFDALYGHRRDPIGYAKAIERFDEKLGLLLDQLEDDTLVMITADHGNDPIHHGTDHTRENVPLVIYYNNCEGKILNNQKSFACIASTIQDNFGLEPIKNIKSLREDL